MDSNKTICPGMPASGAGYKPYSETFQNRAGTHYPVSDPAKSSKPGDKPLIGFVYSVSKTMLGEYWPLRAGSNIIGRSESSDICLQESTVSDKHANLVIRQMHNEDGSTSILSFIQDLGSTCGTMINGVSLGFDPKECKNGDIITIGESYELYFILVNTLELKLGPKTNFTPTEDYDANAVRQASGTQISNVGPQTYCNSSPFDSQKSTIYMPHKK